MRNCKMKMIMAIAEDDIHNEISNSLIKRDFRVTQLASTSGFLREGSTTLMIGVEDEKVDEVLQIIRDTVPKTQDAEKKQITLYVLNIKNFNRI